MALTKYPVFLKGQTLTDADLNDLRTFLDDKDKLLGRLIGFGINCGLTGSVQGTNLRIGSGRAVDQNGDALVLDADVTLALPPPATNASFDFLETVTEGGFTAVLAGAETVEPAVECDEEGCEAHAEQRNRTAGITLVPGRLKAQFADFSDEALLKLEPLRVRPTGTVMGGFRDFAKAIKDRVFGMISEEATTKLGAMTIDGDLPAIQAYKAGFVNEVFFAALDLLRCQRLTGAGCVLPAIKPGVTLGWVRLVGTTWTWDCSFRHDWQPPAGLSLALVGGACADPCDIYRDALDAMILAFSIPVVPPKDAPPATGGTKPDDYIFCKPPKGAGVYYQYLEGFACPWVNVPPEKINPKWREKWVKPKYPPGPIFKDRSTFEDYLKETPDFTDAGMLGLEVAIGKNAEGVAEALKEIVKNEGLGSEVRVVKPNDLGGLGGYRPATTVSVADTLVITKDDFGKVVGVGSIPASHTLRGTATELPKATAAAGRAETVAKGAMETATSLTRLVTEADTRLDGLEGFKEDLSGWRTQTETRLGGLANEVKGYAQSALDARLGSTVETLKEDVLGQMRAEMNGLVGGTKADVTKEVTTVAEGLRKEVRAEQAKITGQLGEVSQQVAGLGASVDSIGREAERGNERIDQVLSGLPDRREPIRTPEFGRDVVGFLTTMRSSIEAAAPAPQRAKVRAELATGDAAFARIEEATRAGADLATEREAFGAVLESLVSAVGAAGAPAADTERLRRDAATVMDRLR